MLRWNNSSNDRSKAPPPYRRSISKNYNLKAQCINFRVMNNFLARSKVSRIWRYSL